MGWRLGLPGTRLDEECEVEGTVRIEEPTAPYVYPFSLPMICACGSVQGGLRPKVLAKVDNSQVEAMVPEDSNPRWTFSGCGAMLW